MTDSHIAQNSTQADAAGIKVGRSVFKRFLVFLILLSAVFVGVSLPVYLEYKNGVQEQLLANEEVAVASAVQMIQKEMYEQLHMLDMLARTHILNEYLAEGTAAQKLRVQKMFETFSTSFHRYDQIRVLDNTGQETIRVNLVDGEGRTVPDEELQNKADRYYFQVKKSMHPGQVYVSLMDLNIEHGVLEEPYKPTLRFLKVLYNKQGEQAGVLVINYLAKGMLLRFRQIMSQREGQQGMLLDGQGYWLSNYERGNEWGADLGRPEHKFAQFFPDAWSVIATNKSGIYENEAGVFRYQSIEPLSFLDSQPAHFRMEHHPLITDESFANANWKLVVFLPRQLINSHSFLNQPLGRTLLILVILMLVGMAFLGAFLTVQRQLRQEKEQQVLALLEQQASIDTLTGIRNRRSFYEHGRVELKRALRYKEPLTALMVDADYFKKVNDTYGHAVGDLVLKELARIMTETLREIDLLGRVGGEEFAVLLLRTSLPEALEVAERLRAKIAALKVSMPVGGSICFTVSIGLAVLTKADQSLEGLFKKADVALYEAKKQGRNRVVSYTKEMSEP
ncbi:MAG: sensor domain-containing diguanylate cyclase [Thiohalomonadaceae bacterium]